MKSGELGLSPSAYPVFKGSRDVMRLEDMPIANKNRSASDVPMKDLLSCVLTF